MTTGNKYDLLEVKPNDVFLIDPGNYWYVTGKTRPSSYKTTDWSLLFLTVTTAALIVTVLFIISVRPPGLSLLLIVIMLLIMTFSVIGSVLFVTRFPKKKNAIVDKPLPTFIPTVSGIFIGPLLAFNGFVFLLSLFLVPMALLFAINMLGQPTQATFDIVTMISDKKSYIIYNYYVNDKPYKFYRDVDYQSYVDYTQRKITDFATTINIKYLSFSPDQAISGNYLNDPTLLMPKDINAINSALFNLPFDLGGVFCCLPLYLLWCPFVVNHSRFLSRRRHNLITALPFATLITGEVIECTGKLMQHKGGPFYYLTLTCCYQSPTNGKTLFHTATQLRIDLIGKLLPKAGTPVIMLFFAKPIRYKIALRQAFLL